MGKTKTLDDLETEVRAFDRGARVPCLRRPIPLFAPPVLRCGVNAKSCTFMRDLRAGPPLTFVQPPVPSSAEIRAGAGGVRREE